MSSWVSFTALLSLASSPGSEVESHTRERVALLCVVLPLDAPPITRSEIETLVAGRVSARPDLELARSEESFSLGMDDPLRTCGSDAPCLAGAIRRLGAQMGLIVIVDASAGSIRLSLRGFESEAGTELASVSRELASEDEARDQLAPEIDRLLNEMGFSEAAVLDVRLTPEDAKLELDPPLLGAEATNHHFRLPPGQYRVAAVREGYEPLSKTIELRAGQVRALELALTPEKTVLASPWFWIAVSAVAIATGAAVSVALGTRDDVWCFSGSNRMCPD